MEIGDDLGAIRASANLFCKRLEGNHIRLCKSRVSASNIPCLLLFCKSSHRCFWKIDQGTGWLDPPPKVTCKHRVGLEPASGIRSPAPELRP